MSRRSNYVQPGCLHKTRRVAVYAYKGKKIVIPVLMVTADNLPYAGHREMWMAMTYCMVAKTHRGTPRTGWPRWALDITDDGVAHPWPTAEYAETIVRQVLKANGSDWHEAEFSLTGMQVAIYPPGVVVSHRLVTDSDGRFLKSLTTS